MSRSYSPEEMAGSRGQSLQTIRDLSTPHGHEQKRESGTGVGADSQPRPDETPETPTTEARVVEARKPYEYRSRTYKLRSSEIEGMTDIGNFRAVAPQDFKECIFRV